MEQSRRDEIKYREGAKTQVWRQPGMDWNQNTSIPVTDEEALVGLGDSPLVTGDPQSVQLLLPVTRAQEAWSKRVCCIGGGCDSYLQVSYKGPHPHLHSVPLLNAIL